MSQKESRWTERFPVNLSPQAYRAVKELARQRETSVAQVARDAIRDHLEKQKETQPR